MSKKAWLNLEQAKAISRDIPTPFHIYNETEIRRRARALNAAFAWNPGFKEYFAVKATPNPQLLAILREENCGTDCSSHTELMMAEACGFLGSDIMFSSNDTPAEDFCLASKLGATINFDDIRHIPFYLDNV
ncbi:MAG: diaminopimelate decarboxylase, partial [Clostridiaceae bacterium]|nr:diaminopimelate decarboxylase [Clostridiaceae bacterium]